MRVANFLLLGAAGLGCVVMLSGCDEDSIFNKFKAHASVYYYNQITSKGAADQSALTTDFYVDADDDASVKGQGYSTTGTASEMEVGLDKDDTEDGVTIRGVSQLGSQLFSKSVRLAENGSYLVVSFGDTSLGTVSVGVWQQDASDVASGSARFRVINTVDPSILADIYSVDLRLQGKDTAFAEDIGLGDATDYQTVDNGTVHIDVLKNSATPVQIIDTVDCSLNSGKTYDAILAVKDPLNPPTDSSEAEDDLALYCHEQDVRVGTK